MSREIDFTKKLSDEDKRYLLQRGTLPEGISISDKEARRLLDSEVIEGRAPITATPTEGDSGDDTEAETVGDGWNSDMSKAELSEVARNRGLPVSGPKQDLIDRLLESDEGDSGDDTEEE